ncbi:MAG: hypothetical protein RMJ98_17265 [Myxococcales bacterium]|nr:hypothetical protein [Polyangiaceae bacterium]MDW8251046.1 hypothetical protein [Myxococcales bacterium]
MMRQAVLLALLLLALVWPNPAEAQARSNSREVKEAKVLFEEGMKLSQESRWAEALDAFEKAYQLNPLPVIKYNIAFNLRALGRYVEARRRLTSLIQETEHLKPSLKPALREDIHNLYEEVRSKVVTLQILLDPPDAELQIDGNPILLDDRGQVELDPGKHVFVLKKEGYETTSVSRTLTSSDKELKLVAPRSETRTVEVIRSVTQPETPLYRRFWFWTATGAAVLGGAVVIYLVTRPAGAPPRDLPPPATVDRIVPTVLRF